MIDESITIIESSNCSSPIEDTISKITTTPKKESSSSVVTPSPKDKEKAAMGSSSIEASGEETTLHSSKDRLLDTDDDTASSYEDDTTDFESHDDSDDDSLDPSHHFNYHIVDTTTASNMDEKQLYFPPTYHPIYTKNNNQAKKATENKANNNIPSYFLCPITHQIMIDPVIDPEGHTYERHAILRWLVLYQNTSPITGNALRMEDLIQDKLVKVAIEKARRDAWVKYILEMDGGQEDGGEEEGSSKKMNDSFQETNNLVKGDLESDLDRKSVTGSSTCHNGSKQSASSGSKLSDRSSSSNSQGKKKKEEVVVPTSTSSSPYPSCSKMDEQQSQQPLLRPATPPPSKIFPSNGQGIGINRSTKSNSSLTSTPKEKQAYSQTHPSLETSPTTNPISTITVPQNNATLHPSPTPALLPLTTSSNTSITSAISFGLEKMHNGWTVPLGVHKVISSSPGLPVSTTVHRRSTPVKCTTRDINNKVVETDLIIASGSYVEILETQVHGGRVRGRIVWEEEDLEKSGSGKYGRSRRKKSKKKKSLLEKRLKRKSKIFQRGRTKKKKEEEDGVHEDDDDDSVFEENNTTKYSGWISIKWAEDEDEDGNNVDRLGNGSDEDDGPWTEPIPLGVYRISFGAGLPLRETPERDSAVLDKLERGSCVEVIETKVKGDRVRARCLVPQLSKEGDETPVRFQSGWISLLNAMTGASGAAPVPLGAYVAVAEGGCVITEGGRLDSKEKGTLKAGSCIDVVATRIEEGTVRGLIAAGGHVTLFVLNGASTDREAAKGSTKNTDGARMFVMPVPLGTYQVVQNGLSVTSGVSINSPVSMKLKVNSCAEIAETRVEGGRVRGRITAVGYGGVAKEAKGWMSLFEPTQRWAKIVCFKGGRPIQQDQSQPAEDEK